ncbi:hypothetical protein GS444_15665 [Rhodococcus hoagii]|nr:hypothetical protein [Prescottella equi]
MDVLGRSLSMPPVTDLMHGNARLMHRRRELEDVVSCGGSFEHGRHGVFISSMPLWWMTIVVTTSKVLSRLTIESGALLDSSGKVTARCPRIRIRDDVRLRRGTAIDNRCVGT